jgi:(2Fe-2S) ferredoxin
VGKDLTKVNKIVFMCSGFTCTKKGGEQNILALRNYIKVKALDEQVHTIKTLCTGQCENGPVMLVYPDGVWYKDVNVSRAENIISRHILKGQLLDNILYKEGDAAMQSLEIPTNKIKE